MNSFFDPKYYPLPSTYPRVKCTQCQDLIYRSSGTAYRIKEKIYCSDCYKEILSTMKCYGCQDDTQKEKLYYCKFNYEYLCQRCWQEGKY